MPSVERRSRWHASIACECSRPSSSGSLPMARRSRSDSARPRRSRTRTSPLRFHGCDVRVLFLSDTHIGFDLPARPRIVRRRRGDDFVQNYERALELACTGGADVVVHGGDLLYRSRVPAWLAEMALAPLKRLAASGVPVLLVPGNHERGRLPFPLLAVHEGLHVFDRPRTVVIESRGVRAAFIGFPYTAGIRHRFAEQLATATVDTKRADRRRRSSPRLSTWPRHRDWCLAAPERGR